MEWLGELEMIKSGGGEIWANDESLCADERYDAEERTALLPMAQDRDLIPLRRRL